MAVMSLMVGSENGSGIKAVKGRWSVTAWINKYGRLLYAS